ncbi:hypothetical protein NIES37_08660 [Tolypothrix tenuis PCC 7101]|uniref:Uncharacterized protein n=1 Tax=Tolypothrix tenuis PCC 7101 TaxID=231146 RepID=A0A1Z4MTX6_9CYAN|nr:hypothetical protein [Aulosira sp. FACHB-113]BAY31648.1 hypothetical protein NIES2107_35340 [Nostoc carneum NIES-2107]BAY96929.1 hypothetical protein NIES37_08660 [Tolypothrix tenuis PCC 7101]BAZ72563.1 hypothetical protein NIES50_11170 [Aulosira laxa NIES-50]
MKLDFDRPSFAVPFKRQNLNCISKPYTPEQSQQVCASRWVKLLQLPNPYSFDEALLLCAVSKHEWLAWIPDHGEVVLHISEFTAK